MKNDRIFSKLLLAFKSFISVLALASSALVLGQNSSSHIDQSEPTAESILLQVDALIVEMTDSCVQRFGFAFVRKYDETTADLRIKKIMSAIALEGEFDTFGRQGNLALAESAYRRHQEIGDDEYAKLAEFVDVAVNDPDFHNQAKNRFSGALYQLHRHHRKACNHLTDISYVQKYYLGESGIFYGDENERYAAIFEELVAEGKERQAIR